MARADKIKENPHLVSLAIELSLRSKIRSFIRRPDTKFVALLRISEKDDAFLYQEAARRLISVGNDYDEEGRELTVVSDSSDLDRSPWNIVTKLKHCRRAMIFHDESKPVSEEIRLASDFEVAVDPPQAVHFMTAARLLGLPELTEIQAAVLARQPLRNVRLAMLRGRPHTRVIDSLLRTPPGDGPPSAEAATSPSLESLFGYGEAKGWGLQLVEDLRDWKEGKIVWEDVDQGILLQGPPGVGKTMFASALANSCGVPLVLGSAARWQAQGHLGDMLKAMRLFFKTASAKAPCIAFIDEVDSFGDRSDDNDKQNLDYKRQVINALLECLAPAEGRTGIVVVGATNDVGRIDSALLRPGRFEKVITIPFPDADARLAIFRHHLPANAGNFDQKAFVAVTRGWTGAQIEKLARDARRHCRRRRGDAITDEDVMFAMPRRVWFTPAERFRLAAHEAGHALITLALTPDNLSGVRIETGNFEGIELIDLGQTTFKNNRKVFKTGNGLRDQMTILLAGLESERLLLGEHSTTAGGHRSSDLPTVTRYATVMEIGFGFGESLVSESDIDDGSLQRYRLYNRDLALAVSNRIFDCRLRARRLLEANKEGLVRLANRLADRVELSGDEVGDIVGTVAYPEDASCELAKALQTDAAGT